MNRMKNKMSWFLTSDQHDKAEVLASERERVDGPAVAGIGH